MRKQTSLGVQREFLEQLEQAIQRFEDETGGRLTKSAFLEMVMKRAGYWQDENRPRRDSNPVSAVFWGFEHPDRNDAFEDAINSHEKAITA